MFSSDNNNDNDLKPKPLASMDDPEPEAPKLEQKSIVRDMNTGEIREVRWVDPAMSANTK
jgi:hypothetical protein